MTSQMLPRDLSNADEEGTGVLSAATIARQMQDLGFMVDATQVDSMARDAGAVVGDSNDIIYGQLLSFIYGNGAVVDQQSGANADTVAIAQMLNSLDSGNRCAFVARATPALLLRILLFFFFLASLLRSLSLSLSLSRVYSPHLFSSPPKHSGLVSMKSALGVLRQSGITVGRERVEALMSSANAIDSGTGEVEYAKFVQYIHQNGGLTYGGALATASLDIPDLLNRLNSVDTNGSGVATASVISKTIRRHLHADIAGEKISQLAADHDALLPDGSVLFGELLRKLSEKGGLSIHGELLGAALDAGEMETVLQSLDVNGSGVLNVGEVGRSFASKGVNISAGRLRTIAEHAGATTSDGGLVWGTLLKYISQNGGISRDGRCDTLAQDLYI